MVAGKARGRGGHWVAAAPSLNPVTVLTPATDGRPGAHCVAPVVLHDDFLDVRGGYEHRLGRKGVTAGVLDSPR